MGNTIGILAAEEPTDEKIKTSDKDAMKLAIFRTLVKECRHRTTALNAVHFYPNIQKINLLLLELDPKKLSTTDRHLFKSSHGVFKKLSKFANPTPDLEEKKSLKTTVQNLPAHEEDGWLTVSTAEEMSDLEKLTGITQALKLALTSKNTAPGTVALQVSSAVKLFNAVKAQPPTFANKIKLSEAKETVEKVRTHFNLFTATEVEAREEADTAKNLSSMQRNPMGK